MKSPLDLAPIGAHATWLNLLLALCALYLLICLGAMAYLYAYQRTLVFQPGSDYFTPAHWGLAAVDEQRLDTADGEQVMVWTSQQDNNTDKNAPLILVFYGNSYAMPGKYLLELERADLPFMALSYRGFPGSSGTPTEQGLYTDARTLIQHALAENRTSQRPLCLMGISLGSGVATQMAQEFEIDCLILVTPFLSIYHLVRTYYWYLPIPKFLLKDRFESDKKIVNLTVPTLFVHGTADLTVPYSQGYQLYSLKPSPKQLVTVEGAPHTIDPVLLTREIEQYFSQKLALW